MQLRPGVPTLTSLPDDSRIRKIRLNDKIPKNFWYTPLAGIVMMVYMFPGYADAVSVSLPIKGPIDNNHFTLVKYALGRNDDIRHKPMKIVAPRKRV
jgi:hypothetical protein